MSVHILLIEDHPLFVDGFVAMVGENRPEWSVAPFYTATDGCKALSEQSHWDLAIVDIQLPDADGFDTISRMVELSAAVPRIIISGREDAAARFRARRAGARSAIPSATVARAWVWAWRSCAGLRCCSEPRSRSVHNRDADHFSI